MKIMAVIVSCLILALSAGANNVTPQVRAVETPACCCCESEAGTSADIPEDNQDSGTGSTSCPFCPTHTCPGFSTQPVVHLQVFLTSVDTRETFFADTQYSSPQLLGIWQPPRAA